MATGGWISRKVAITDSTVGHTPSDIPSNIVKLCADALVDTGKGWAVDLDYVVGGITQPDRYWTYTSSSYYSYGAVVTLTNTTADAQLAIGFTIYNASNVNSSYYKASVARSRGTILWTGHDAANDYYYMQNGLWIQYIPKKSVTGVFDTTKKPYDENWSPTKALPWVGGWCPRQSSTCVIPAAKRSTPFVYSSTGNAATNCIYDSQVVLYPNGANFVTNLLASIQYTIFVVTDGESVMMVQVGDGTNLSTSTNPQALLYSGKLFGSLANPTDESGTMNAKYGCFTNALKDTHPFSVESLAQVVPNTTTVYDPGAAYKSGLIACFNKGTDLSTDLIERNTGNSTYDSSGFMALGSTGSYCYVGGDIRGINPAFHASTVDNAVRYSKIQLGWYTSDIANHGVTSLDCVKGYIDSNTMIAVPAGVLAPWQLLDSGKMIYVGGGVAIGWDASNDPPF